MLAVPAGMGREQLRARSAGGNVARAGLYSAQGRNNVISRDGAKTPRPPSPAVPWTGTASAPSPYPGPRRPSHWHDQSVEPHDAGPGGLERDALALRGEHRLPLQVMALDDEARILGARGLHGCRPRDERPQDLDPRLARRRHPLHAPDEDPAQHHGQASHTADQPFQDAHRDPLLFGRSCRRAAPVQQAHAREVSQVRRSAPLLPGGEEPVADERGETGPQLPSHGSVLSGRACVPSGRNRVSPRRSRVLSGRSRVLLDACISHRDSPCRHREGTIHSRVPSELEP